MKLVTLLSALLTSALAAPTTPTLDTAQEIRTIGLLSKSSKPNCPANAAQPDGKLPKGSVSTSALVPISLKNPKTVYPNSDWSTVFHSLFS